MAFHKKVPITNLIYIEKKQVIRFNRNAEHADLADFRGFFNFAEPKIRYEPLRFYFFRGVLCVFRLRTSKFTSNHSFNF